MVLLTVVLALCGRQMNIDAPPGETSPGCCGVTQGGSAGDCEHGDRGTVYLGRKFGEHEGERSTGSMVPDEAACIAWCAACPRCNYISYSFANADCSWYHSCNFTFLRSREVQRITGDDTYTTVHVPKTKPMIYSHERRLARFARQMQGRTCDLASAVARKSECPDGGWHDRVSHLLQSPSMTFVNVGANKGYKVAEFLQRYVGLAPTYERWHQALLRHKPGLESDCGVCQDCLAPAPALAQGQRASVKVFAIELLGQLARMLRTMFEEYSIDGAVIHAAVSNESCIAFEPRSVRLGKEFYTISEHPHGRRVTCISLEQFSRQYDVGQIDVLTIDTEGWDALVIEGAKSLLSQRRVKVIEFEYHSVGLWSSHATRRRNLRDIVSMLTSWQYECFWQGVFGMLAPMSGASWCDQFEFRSWSNVVCAHQPDVLRVFHELSVQDHDWPFLSGFCRGTRNVWSKRDVSAEQEATSFCHSHNRSSS